MRPAKAILMTLLVSSLAAYSFDCFAASTPDEAMQCCDSMPCPHHSHEGSQDCCQTMRSLHVPFMQSHPADAALHALVFFAMLPGADPLQSLDSQAQTLLAVNSHAPPGPPMAASIPLRI